MQRSQRSITVSKNKKTLELKNSTYGNNVFKLSDYRPLTSLRKIQILEEQKQLTKVMISAKNDPKTRTAAAQKFNALTDELNKDQINGDK